MSERHLTRNEALTIMRNNREIDLYMGADFKSWALTNHKGHVSEETANELLKTGALARRWREMPCWYRYGDQSIVEVVRRDKEVWGPAVRDRTVALAKAEYRDFERRKEEERREIARQKNLKARARRAERELQKSSLLNRFHVQDGRPH